MCVGKALSHNFATVTLPVSEAPNWLGAGTPSAPGVTVAHPQGRAGPGCLFFINTLLVTRRVTDLLDDGSILLCEQLIGAIPIIGHRGPCPAGVWGVLPS